MTDRVRRIAILIDGGFFERRLPKLVNEDRCDAADKVANCARLLCKRHVQFLTGESFSTHRSRWLDHVYRLFYYDAIPYEGKPHHPILNKQIDFGKTDAAQFHRDLHDALRSSRKFAVRLGKVTKESDWAIRSDLTKKILKTKDWLHLLESPLTGQSVDHSQITPEQKAALEKVIETWRTLGEEHIRYGLRQKGVDMRIGIDISSITLKQQADTIILVTGDSDFVPAAKLARREGVEFIIDPLWQSVNADLMEHVDGIQSGFRKPDPRTGKIPDDDIADEHNDTDDT